MTPSPTLRKLAASTAVALAFSPLAHAAGLIDGQDNALGKYRPAFSIALRQAAGDDLAGGRARGFMVELEKALAAPSDKTRVLVYPQDNSTNMLVVAAVVPPKGFEALPIPVCAQQNNKVVGTWNITAKGEVQPVAWNGPAAGEVVPNVGVKPACGAFINVARADINQKLAQNPPGGNTPAQPPPTPSGKMVSAVPVPPSGAQVCRVTETGQRLC